MKGHIIRRREFLLGGAAAAWPLAARAQQGPMAVIGLLHLAAPQTYALTGFHQGLREAGYIEGQNLTVEYRWANNDVDRLSQFAADLVQRRVAVIVTIASSSTTLAVKSATTTIPIVFGFGSDPVEIGVVSSLNRPGGNITGATSMSGELAGKQLGLLHELVPAAARFAALVNPRVPAGAANAPGASLGRDIQAAALAMGRQIEIFAASTIREIDTAFASIVQKRAEALLVANDPLFLARRVQIVTLATRHAVPTIYPFREYGEVGGIMVYGPNLQDRDRQVGIYTGRILKGEKPADLPVQRPTKFEFVINLQTARTLGIEVPPTLLALADEVIE